MHGDACAGAGAADPRLSVVVGARNDDYGGMLLRRVQTFVNALAAQAERHRLRLELVFVDWNSPAPFAGALRWPPGGGQFRARTIEVPPALHRTLPHGDELTYREWHAKNVGIRRARAPFVLATNVDDVLSDELAAPLAGSLREGAFYRADRVDVAASPDPGTPLDDLLALCRANAVRRYGWSADRAIVPGNGDSQARPAPRAVVRTTRAVRSAPGTLRRHGLRPARLVGVARERWARELGLHTDASGDFTLLSRERWHDLRGYPEWGGHGVHLDGLFLYECHFAGLRQTILPGVLYHLDHARRRPPTSPMTAADAGRAPWVSTEELYDLTLETVHRRGPVLPHSDDWGLADHSLREVVVA